MIPYTRITHSRGGLVQTLMKLGSDVVFHLTISAHGIGSAMNFLKFDGSRQGYYPGESVLSAPTIDFDFHTNTVMRLGALEILANIFSGRVTANDKDPFPHQLALQQYLKASNGHVKRLLIADEVGLGKTIEIGLVLRDLLIEKGSLEQFRCLSNQGWTFRGCLL